MTDDHSAPRRGAAHPVRVAAAAWDLRAARALPFALVCTLIAAAGHALIGDGEVTGGALALGFAVVYGLAALLGGRERSLPAIAAALGAGQLGLHVLFHLCRVGGQGMVAHGMPAGNAETLAGRLVCLGSSHGGLTIVPLDRTPEQLIGAAGLDPQVYQAAAPHTDALLGLSPAMLLGHLAAALVAGWWLRCGEAALWRLVRVTASAAQTAAQSAAHEWAGPLRTALALIGALLLGPARASERPRRERPGDWQLPVTALRHSVVRRGPPVAAFAR